MLIAFAFFDEDGRKLIPYSDMLEKMDQSFAY